MEGLPTETGQLVIQEARPEDAKWIAGFQVAMALETESMVLDEDTVREGVSRIFQETHRGFYVVARGEGGERLGCLLVLREWSDWRNADVWWMHSVYVTPSCRNRGIFRQMFQYVEDLAVSSGVRGLRLYVERGNHRAKAVYSRLGMGDDHYELFEKMF